MITATASGFALGLSLIVAIGAQNAYVLRQGLSSRHVFVICLICALSDAILIAVGVGGFGTLIQQSEVLIRVATWGGAAFLAGYAILSLRRALAPEALVPTEADAGPLLPAVGTALALTWLNPHVYLDTVILLGSLSAGYAGADRIAFGAGAVVASFAWFFALGYGARFLTPIFAKPVAWRVLDLIIATVMAAIALSLVLG
ncbi:MAG: LysE/ArgO family amino acid transporter [Pseudomonadota bacterium]